MARKLLLLYIAMALSALALHVAFGDAPRVLLQPGTLSSHAPELDIALGMSIGLLTVLLSRFMSARFQWAQSIDGEFREMLAPLTAHHVPALAVMSALAEELLFRGFLQPHLGLIATSLLFGLAHLPHRRQMVPWTLAAIGMGFVFGWLVEARGLLLAPFLAHFTVNFFNLHQLLRPLNPEEIT